MRIKQLLCFVVMGMTVACNAQATMKSKKKSKTYIKLVEAYNKKAADPGNPPETGDHFVIVWEDATYPETFFWRGQGGWLSCKIEPAHKVKKGVYTTGEATGGDQIHKGDTLMLSPTTGGRFPIPSEISQKAKNTIFFKAGGSAWLSFPVSKISKK